MRTLALFADSSTCEVKARLHQQMTWRPPEVTLLNTRTEDLLISAKRGLYAAMAFLQAQGSRYPPLNGFLAFELLSGAGSSRQTEFSTALQTVGRSADLLFAVLSAVTLLVPQESATAFSGTLAVTGEIAEASESARVTGVAGICKKIKAGLRGLQRGDKLFYPAEHDSQRISDEHVPESLKTQAAAKGVDLLPVRTVAEALQHVLPLVGPPAPGVSCQEPLRGGQRWQIRCLEMGRALHRLVRRRGPRRRGYTFGLYGLRGSGKTCILAALALSRREHPQQFNCTWRSRPGREPAAAFQAGTEMLEKARAALLDGVVPEPTSVHLPEPLRFVYDFTTPKDGTFSVEFIDYSGELLDPSMTDHAKTQRLWEYMSAVDGLLVLAETPWPGNEGGALWSELRQLTEALHNLDNRRAHTRSARRQVVPVALLVNKWDRRGALDYAHPETEHRALQQFLYGKDEPPHRQLFHVLQSVTGGHCAIFPVSAFGETTTLAAPTPLPRQGQALASSSGADGDENSVETTMLPAGTEIPLRVEPLHPFGLLDGFIDLVRRRDALDWQQEVAKVRQILFGIPILLLLLVGGETFLDHQMWTTVSTHLETPQATQADLHAATQWLRAYAGAPWYRHRGSRSLVLSPPTALTTLQQLDERAWQGVVAAADPLQQARLVQTYVAEYPNGRHGHEANGMLHSITQRRHTQENAQYVTALHLQVQELEARDDPAQQQQAWQTLRQRLQQLPYPDAVTPELIEQQTALRALIETALLKVETMLAQQQRTEHERANLLYLADLDSELRGLPAPDRTEAQLRALRARIDQLPHPVARSPEIATRQDELHQQVRTAADAQSAAAARARWQQFVAQYNTLMQQDKQVIAAWQHLHTWSSQTAEWQQLVEDFQAQMLVVLQAHWSGLFQQNPRAWSEARSVIDAVRHHSAIRATLTPDQQQRLEAMHAKIDTLEDRTLYEDVLRQPDRDSIARYLQHAPVRKKVRVVQAYQQYLDALPSTLPLTLILERINWGNTWNGYRNTVLVSVNGKIVIEEHGIIGRRFLPSPLQARGRFEAKLDDPIQLSIKVICQPSAPLGWADNAGEGFYNRTVKALDGLTIPLPAAGHQNEAVFRLEGIPQKPLLPDWDTP